jgi:hypothetical protein
MNLVPSATADGASGTPNAGRARVLWTANVGQVLRTDSGSGPVVALNGATLSGITRTNGRVIWQNQLPKGGSGGCTATIASGVAFAACPSGATTHSGATVLAVNVATGRTRWTRSTTSWSATYLTATDDVVAVAGDPFYWSGNDAGYRTQGVYALSGTSGALLWHQKAPSTQVLTQVPLAVDSLIFISSGGTGTPFPSSSRAVDATTGTALWSTTPGCYLSVYTALTATYQSLYAACDQNEQEIVVALNPANGATEWTVPVPGNPGPVVLDVTTTTVVVGGGARTTGIDRATGTTSWTVDGKYLSSQTSLMYFLQQTKPIDSLNPDAGKVVDINTGATVGNFGFAGGWVPSGQYTPVNTTEVIMRTGTGPAIAAIRLPTVGWIPPSVALVSTPDGDGYWLAGQDGGVFAYGDAPFEGSLPALGVPVDDIVAMAATPDGRGYWLVGQDGGVFAFGDARFYGSAADLSLAAPVVGIAPTPDGAGYWLVGTDGGVFAYGDAHFYGTGNKTVPGARGQVVSIAPTSDGGGYWLAVLPSQMIPFGDAQAFSNRPANVVPVPQMATTPNRNGYWFVGQDGGVFSAGTAQFYGSVPGLGLRIDDAIDITSTPDGGGYWVLGTDGGVFAFGDAQFYGSSS